MAIKKPVKLGLGVRRNRKANLIDALLKTCSKNLGSTLVIMALLVFVISIFISKPRTEQQTKALENMQSLINNMNALAAKDRSTLVKTFSNQDRKDARVWWTSLTDWQRQVVMSVIHAQLTGGKLQATVGQVLRTPNLKQLMYASVPDITETSFPRDPVQIFDLTSAFIRNDHLNKEVMGEEPYNQLLDIAKHGFWGGMEIFEEKEKSELSMEGWNAARGCMLGRFIILFAEEVKDKLEMLANGEEIVWPEEPIPEASWSDELYATEVVFSSESSFEEDVLEKSHALVMFYAPWCGHCKKFKPDFSAAALLLAGKVVLAAVDTTIEKELGDKYEIRSYPTLLYYQNGKVVSTFDSRPNVQSVVRWLNEEGRLSGALSDLIDYDEEDLAYDENFLEEEEYEDEDE